MMSMFLSQQHCLESVPKKKLPSLVISPSSYGWRVHKRKHTSTGEMPTCLAESKAHDACAREHDASDLHSTSMPSVSPVSFVPERLWGCALLLVSHMMARIHPASPNAKREAAPAGCR